MMCCATSEMCALQSVVTAIVQHLKCNSLVSNVNDEGIKCRFYFDPTHFIQHKMHAIEYYIC